MTITKTHLHYKRVIDQIERNLVGLQLDMLHNAIDHKAMAQAQAPDYTTLRGFVADCATRYSARLAYILSIRSHPEWPNIRAAYVAMGGSEAAAVDLYTELKVVADGLAGAALPTYASIINACDQIIATVDAPLSLWPE